MVSQTRRYGGVTQEERKRLRRENLLKAAADVVADVGTNKLTVTQVCKRAGLTERYFYESFTDRHALIDELVATLASEHFVAIAATAALGPDDRRERLRLAVGAILHAYTSDTAFGRLAIELNSQGALARHRTGLVRTLANLVSQHAQAVFGLHDLASIEIHMAIRYAVAGSMDLIVDWLTGSLECEQAQLIDACAELGYAVMRTALGPPER